MAPSQSRKEHTKKEKEAARKRGPSLLGKGCGLGRKARVVSGAFYYEPTHHVYKVRCHLPKGKTLPDLTRLFQQELAKFNSAGDSIHGAIATCATPSQGNQPLIANGETASDASINVRTSTRTSGSHTRKATRVKRSNRKARSHKKRRSARLRAPEIDDDEESSAETEHELDIIDLQSQLSGQSPCPGNEHELDIIALQSQLSGQCPSPANTFDQSSLGADSLIRQDFRPEDGLLSQFPLCQPAFTPPGDYTLLDLDVDDEWERIDRHFLSDNLIWPEGGAADTSLLSPGTPEVRRGGIKTTQQEESNLARIASILPIGLAGCHPPITEACTMPAKRPKIFTALTLQWTFACGLPAYC
ncbi:hypothetical protein V8C37DRAFT_397171 [Trichoderma ceciliae]